MDIGVTILRILAPFYIVVATKLTADGILRGAGRMNRFMIATFTDLVLRVILAALFSKTSMGINGIWLAWTIGWVIGMLLSLCFYKTLRWNKDSAERPA